MMDGRGMMDGWGMMSGWGMAVHGIGAILVLTLLILAIAALIKYLVK